MSHSDNLAATGRIYAFLEHNFNILCGNVGVIKLFYTACLKRMVNVIRVSVIKLA